MFGDHLDKKFGGLQAEFNQKLYRFFILKRELEMVEKDITRIEAALAEMETTIKDYKIDQTAAKLAEETPNKPIKAGDKLQE